MKSKKIIMKGTGGTSLGKFIRTKHVGYLNPTEFGFEVRSLDGTLYGEIKRDHCVAHVLLNDKFTAHTFNDWDGYSLVANHCKLGEAFSAIMGKPGYGYSWYALS